MVKYENVDKKMLISNEPELIKINEDKYKVNIVLMKYLKIINRIDIIKQIIDLINNDLSNEIFSKMKKRKINLNVISLLIYKLIFLHFFKIFFSLLLNPSSSFVFE